jgi:hypothetical protein
MAKADSSAEASRIFEYNVPRSKLQLEEAHPHFDKLNDHFGVAAEPYVLALSTRGEVVRARGKHWMAAVG